MSIAAGVWRQTLDRATDLRRRGAASYSPALDSANAVLSRTPLTALVQWLFFFPVRRTQILFVAADDTTPIAGFCERVGRVVAEVSRASVLIVDGNSITPADCDKTDPQAGGSVSDRNSTVQLAANLWEVTLDQFEAESTNMTAKGRVFEYQILAANISDPAQLSFCERCDGAVLVVTANRTRREAAVRAKEILLSWNIELLGAVLDDRTFPIPECVYRRL